VVDSRWSFIIMLLTLFFFAYYNRYMRISTSIIVSRVWKQNKKPNKRRRAGLARLDMGGCLLGTRLYTVECLKRRELNFEYKNRGTTRWIDLTWAHQHRTATAPSNVAPNCRPSPNILQTAEAEKIFSEIYLFKKSNDKLGNCLILFRHSESTDSSSTAEW
jgi:hypothetical protein